MFLKLLEHGVLDHDEAFYDRGDYPQAARGRCTDRPGQFRGLHGLATDSKGNIFTADTRNARPQKFASKGMSQ